MLVGLLIIAGPTNDFDLSHQLYPTVFFLTSTNKIKSLDAVGGGGEQPSLFYIQYCFHKLYHVEVIIPGVL